MKGAASRTPAGYLSPSEPLLSAVFLPSQGRGIDMVYPYGYTKEVPEVRKTDIFAQWLDRLVDLRGRARNQARIERLAAGNAGDTKPVGEGVSEMRVDCGPGYRVYFKRLGRETSRSW